MRFYIKQAVKWSIISALALLVGMGIGRYGTVAAKAVVEHFEYYGSMEYKKARLYAIYDRLKVNTGMYTVQLDVINNPQINAWTDGNTITFTTAILDFFQNDDEAAGVLAHEMAHVMMRHVQEYDTSTLSITDKEAQADKMAVYLLLRSGFDVCSARMFYPQLAKIGSGDQADTEVTVHPSYAYRYAAMSLPWCSKGDYL